MEQRGELSASDAQRLGRRALDHGEGPRIDALSKPGTRTCNNAAREAIRRWLRSNGADGPPAPPPPSSIGHLESSSLPLRVYYQTEADQPLAQQVLIAAELAWQKQVVELSYPKPYTAANYTDPAVPGLYLYVGDTGMGGGGFTEWIRNVPDTPQADCSARVAIDSANYEGDVAFVVAHEFNHATQMATDCVEAISAWENFATASGDYFYPGDWTTQYFIQAFQQYPEMPVDYWQNPDGSSDLSYFQYGASLFPIFLRDRFGKGSQVLLRDAWYSFAQEGTVTCSFFGCVADKPNDPDWFKGLDNMLHLHGSTFDDAFDEFAAWRAITGSRDDGFHFQSGSSIGEVSTAATHYLKQGGAKGKLDVHEYGSRYIELRTDGYSGPVHVQVKPDAAASWSVSLLSWRKAEPVERRATVLPAGESADVYVASAQGIQRMMLVVSQRKDATHLPDEQEYETTREFEYVVDDDLEPDAGTKPEPMPEAGVDAKSDAKPDAKLDAGKDVDAEPIGVETSADDGGCDCRASRGTAPRRSVFSVLLAAIAVCLRRRSGWRKSLARA